MEQIPVKKLYRSNINKIIFGVCGGLGEYFGIDPLIFRIAFIVLAIFGGGSGIILYLLLALIIPRSDLGNTANEPDFVQSRRNLLGAILVIFGVLLILSQFFRFYFFNWSFFWAVLIIALGLLILFKRRRRKGDTDEKNQNENDSEKQNRPFRRHYRFPGPFKTFFGLFLLLIGAIILAQNLNLISTISFNPAYLLRFWPVLIILLGLSFLSIGTLFGRTLAIIFSLALVGLIATAFFVPEKTAESKVYNFDIQKDQQVQTADLTIKSGVSNLTVKSSTTSLTSGYLESNSSLLALNSYTENTTQKVTLQLQNNMARFGGNYINNLNVDISRNIPLSLTINSGASDLNLDLSDLQVKNFNISSGASHINLILGTRMATSSFGEINSGVSSIDISLPKDLGAKIIVSDALSSKSFPDFQKLNNNTYQSNNYDSAQKHVSINVKAAVSNISANWR